YGSTFFMLTGFHGFHVTVGTIMLIVIYFRCAAGHFKPEHHFGFEGVAWYWHFVDVVWLGLFIFVYLL
ncbi:MAG TPA: cytochrome c oxidase subunit 3, partial [Nitrosomonas sp.]|nr:cytochrome c oxidase subunit 3 [Nitrosomonas sp.]